MAQNFIACDREQALLLPPSLRAWLPAGHLAWFVLDAVEQIDLTAFYSAYRADGHGRAAHDPAMMVALVLYAYAVGERSSRGIERRCVEDVAFRVVAANQAPDTRQSIASARAIRTRWPTCSVRCSGSARGPARCRSASSRWTRRGCAPTPRTRRTAATSSSRARSSRRPPRSTPPKTSSTARRAATSCPRSWPTRRRDAAKLKEARDRLRADWEAKQRELADWRQAKADYTARTG